MEALLNLIQDKRLFDVAQKVLSGERLSFEDGLKLFESNDMATISALADYASRKKSGDFVYFNVNVHITPTNICVGTCRFCAFKREKGQDGAYALTIEQILEKLEKLNLERVTEFHIVGGLNPDYPYSFYVELLRTLKRKFPNVYLKAFTAEELNFIAEVSKKSVEEVLLDLIDAGLDFIPGGGGEIFAPSVRSRICPDKISAERYLQIHKTAHRLGLKSNATMLFGHIESYEDRVDHMLRLREAQDETGGFQTFIPLAYHPLNTKIKGQYTTAADELKTIAVSRLLLDNFPHIKAYWIMLGEKTAQIALKFGADDIDGTVVEEEITQAAGARSGSYMPQERLIKLIREVGKIPVERDTVYNIVKIH